MSEGCALFPQATNGKGIRELRPSTKKDFLATLVGHKGTFLL